jgi:hypothetical protein
MLDFVDDHVGIVPGRKPTRESSTEFNVVRGGADRSHQSADRFRVTIGRLHIRIKVMLSVT